MDPDDSSGTAGGAGEGTVFLDRSLDGDELGDRLDREVLNRSTPRLFGCEDLESRSFEERLRDAEITKRVAVADWTCVGAGRELPHAGLVCAKQPSEVTEPLREDFGLGLDAGLRAQASQVPGGDELRPVEFKGGDDGREGFDRAHGELAG